jgi:hypothetical protein
VRVAHVSELCTILKDRNPRDHKEKYKFVTDFELIDTKNEGWQVDPPLFPTEHQAGQCQCFFIDVLVLEIMVQAQF